MRVTWGRCVVGVAVVAALLVGTPGTADAKVSRDGVSATIAMAQGGGPLADAGYVYFAVLTNTFDEETLTIGPPVLYVSVQGPDGELVAQTSDVTVAAGARMDEVRASAVVEVVRMPDGGGDPEPLGQHDVTVEVTATSAPERYGFHSRTVGSDGVYVTKAVGFSRAGVATVVVEGIGEWTIDPADSDELWVELARENRSVSLTARG